MTDTEVAEIIARRLTEFAPQLVEQHAVPVLLLAVGQDEQHGETRVFKWGDDPGDNAFLAKLLRRVADELERQVARLPARGLSR